jgi:hypothetical protein
MRIRSCAHATTPFCPRRLTRAPSWASHSAASRRGGPRALPCPNKEPEHGRVSPGGRAHASSYPSLVEVFRLFRPNTGDGTSRPPPGLAGLADVRKPRRRAPSGQSSISGSASFRPDDSSLLSDNPNRAKRLTADEPALFVMEVAGLRDDKLELFSRRRKAADSASTSHSDSLCLDRRRRLLSRIDAVAGGLASAQAAPNDPNWQAPRLPFPTALPPSATHSRPMKENLVVPSRWNLSASGAATSAPTAILSNPSRISSTDRDPSQAAAAMRSTRPISGAPSGTRRGSSRSNSSTSLVIAAGPRASQPGCLRASSNWTSPILEAASARPQSARELTLSICPPQTSP